MHTKSVKIVYNTYLFARYHNYPVVFISSSLFNAISKYDIFEYSLHPLASWKHAFNLIEILHGEGCSLPGHLIRNEKERSFNPVNQYVNLNYPDFNMPLPINIKDLLAGKTVESDRIEYKRGCNPGPVYRSICAFANDMDDIGGGYIVIGVREENGKPILPPEGLDENEIDQIQKQMIGFNNLINPAYYPRTSLEEIDGKIILVIWVLSGPNRPYEVPDEIKAKEKKHHYYIRYNASTVKANKQQREELIALSNKIPFDDRPNTQADTGEISFTLIKEHLRLTKSKLLDWVDTHSKEEILFSDATA